MRKSFGGALARVLIAGIGMFLAGAQVSAQTAFNSCGGLAASFGPYDYRTADVPTKRLVESAHFPPGVEALIAGSTGSVGSDIAYTLRVFPNHHRALIAMMNLGIKLKVPMAPGAGYTVDCFFNRALRFRTDDAIVHIIYAKYLATYGRKPEAIKQLEIASGIEKDNGFTQYNVGLFYLEINEFDRALAQAHSAMALGFDRPALKERLVAAKRWREPPAPSAPPAATDAAASGSAAPTEPVAASASSAAK